MHHIATAWLGRLTRRFALFQPPHMQALCLYELFKMKLSILASLIFLITSCSSTHEQYNLVNGDYRVIPFLALLYKPEEFNGKNIAVSAYAKEASYRGFLDIYPSTELASVDDSSSSISLLPSGGYAENDKLLSSCKDKMVMVLGTFNYHATIDNGEVILWHREIYPIPMVLELGKYVDEGGLHACYRHEDTNL